MTALSTLMMFDWMFTITGVRLGLIVEANPFLIWMFDLPVVASLLCRCVMVVGIMFLFELIRTRAETAYKRLMIGGTCLYGAIMIIHSMWMGMALKGGI
jgi:hypothetical protein